jgi:hypothetical protein
VVVLAYTSGRATSRKNACFFLWRFVLGDSHEMNKKGRERWDKWAMPLIGHGRRRRMGGSVLASSQDMCHNQAQASPAIDARLVSRTLYVSTHKCTACSTA